MACGGQYIIMFCMEFILHKILKYKLNNLYVLIENYFPLSGNFRNFQGQGGGVDELSGAKGDGDLGPRAGGWQIFRYNFKFNQRYTMLGIISISIRDTPC